MPAQPFILKIKENKLILYKFLLAAAIAVIILLSFTVGYLVRTNNPQIRPHTVAEFQDDQSINDEESSPRVELSAAGIKAAQEIDPVCGMTMASKDAHAAGRVSQYRGKTYYFCSDQCKERFERSPESYLLQAGKSAGRNAEAYAETMPETPK